MFFISCVMRRIRKAALDGVPVARRNRRGERYECCRWQKKRVERVAAVKIRMILGTATGTFRRKSEPVIVFPKNFVDFCPRFRI